MRDYRIAFFTADWNAELVESTLRGLKRFTEEHRNLHLAVFNCFGKDADTARSRNEYGIYGLADLSGFDGAVVQANQVMSESARRSLGERIRSAGVPAVSIGCPMPGCTLVHAEDEEAQYRVTQHLIRGHGAARLCYLTGNLDNGCDEAERRLKGFLRACADSGIPEEDTEILRCMWRTADGAQAVRDRLREGRALPDAFVCANDEMALGVMDALREAGKRVPQDVMVTGYDHIPSARFSGPGLTTVRVDAGQLACRALQVLTDRLEGQAPVADAVLGHEVILSESCGCARREDPETVQAQYFRQTRQLKRFYLMQDRLAESLFGATGLEDLAGELEKNGGIFGCEKFFLCLNRYYYDSYDRADWKENTETYGREMVLAACGGRDGPAKCAFRGKRFPAGQLLPEAPAARERFLVLYPLHYGTYSIGYLALNGISDAAALNLLESVISFIEIAIDNVRRKRMLRKLNEQLAEQAVRDGLTGCYNRFGLERLGGAYFRRVLEDYGAVQVVFIDMDDMKGINDRLGHDRGDMALRLTADVLRSACEPEDFIMRYGGDEFLAVSRSREERLPGRIRDCLRKRREEAGCAWLPEISVGCARAVLGDGKDLEACMKEADRRMYRDKRARRKGAR